MIQTSMRRLFVIFMIALLPLRAWAADAMVVSMALRLLLPAQTASVSIPTSNSTMKADSQQESFAQTECPMLGQFTVDTAPDAGQGSVSPLCKGCTTCQLCMALATWRATPIPTVPTLPYATPLTGSSGFASADALAGFKPPIS
jgi:hypothetical protein